MKLQFTIKQWFRTIALICTILSIVLFGNFRLLIHNNDQKPIKGSWYEFWVGDTEVFGYHVFPTFYGETGREIVVFNKYIWHSIPIAKSTKK